MILSVERLTVSYGGLRALDDVSLHVAPGELVTLLGANGAGKTTLLRTISGLKRPDSGGVHLLGENITRTRPARIVARGIAHVPEHRGVFGPMTVEENLMLGAFLDRRAASAVSDRRSQALALFPQLASRLGQLAGTLSGGEQQMLAIGRAIMAAPKLLILDEPTLGLAPRLASTVLAAVSDLSAQGLAVLLVEQRAGQALRIADRAYVLDRGAITLEGPAAELARSQAVRDAYLGKDPADLPSPNEGPIPA
jgi:branched-chain amino acid transport system ATP-binding protein